MRKINDEIKNALRLTILALSFQLPFFLPAFAQNAEQDAKDGQYEREIGNFSDAFKILNRGCNNGSANACASLGSMYFGDQGIPKDMGKSFSLATSACDKGSMRGCSLVGYHYQMGDPKIKNLETAIYYYQRACDGGFGNGCSNLGHIYYTGLSVTLSKEKSLGLFKKGCELESGHACQNVAYFYRQGEVVAKEISKAITYYEKGCRFNFGPSCGALAYLYQGQEGVAKDLTTAKSFGEFGCSIKDTESCFQLGYIEATFLSQPQKALGHYQFACDKNVYLACNRIGSLFLFGNMGPRDLKKAKQYYQKACQAGDQMGCENLKTADHLAVETKSIDQIVKEAQGSSNADAASKTPKNSVASGKVAENKNKKKINPNDYSKTYTNEELDAMPWVGDPNEVWNLGGGSNSKPKSKSKPSNSKSPLKQIVGKEFICEGEWQNNTSGWFVGNWNTGWVVRTDGSDRETFRLIILDANTIRVRGTERLISGDHKLQYRDGVYYVPTLMRNPGNTVSYGGLREGYETQAIYFRYPELTFYWSEDVKIMGLPAKNRLIISCD